MPTRTQSSSAQGAFAFSFPSPDAVAPPLPQPAAVPPAPPRAPLVAEVVAMPAPGVPGKACKTCGVWKPLTEFSPQATGALGHKARCKPCFNAGVIARKIVPPPPPDPVPLDADGNPAAKRCKTCGEMKPLGEFSPANLGLFGRVAHCKACNNAAWRASFIPKRPPQPPVPLDAEGNPLTKRCKGCGEAKPLDAFHLHPDCQHGRAPKCRACEKDARVNPKPRRAAEPDGFKCCTHCGETKPLQEFSPDKRGRRGVFARCRQCHAEHYVPRPPDPTLDRETTSRTCTGCGGIKLLAEFAVSPKGPSGYETRCRACVAKYLRGWVEKNMPRVIAATAKRRAALLCATPAWMTPAHFAEIEGHYMWTDLFRGHHVDHVIPLKGQGATEDTKRGRGRGGKQIVCGLHTGHNLQPLTEAENRSKGPRIIPGTERAEANEYGTRRPIWDAASWWDDEWAAMGFPGAA